jgi:hypothetical protein
MVELRAKIMPDGSIKGGRVVRRTVDVYPASRNKKIIIALEPGDVIALKEERSQTWYRAPISRVFSAVVQWTVNAEKMEAKKCSR